MNFARRLLSGGRSGSQSKKEEPKPAQPTPTITKQGANLPPSRPMGSARPPTANQRPPQPKPTEAGRAPRHGAQNEQQMRAGIRDGSQKRAEERQQQRSTQRGQPPSTGNQLQKSKTPKKDTSSDEEDSEDESSEEEVGPNMFQPDKGSNIAQDLIIQRQRTQIDFLKRENDCMKQEIDDMTTNLQVNKQLVLDLQNAMVSQIEPQRDNSGIEERKSSAGDTHNTSALETNVALIQGYEEREVELKDQITIWKRQYEKARADLLIQKQLNLDTKVQQADQNKEYLEEIDALKDKLDKTEYIIQFKEEIWTYLEREISKVIKKDSELHRKVQAKTRILTDCLAQTKVSNVVKQNSTLVTDHAKACTKIQILLQNLWDDLAATENMQVQGNDMYRPESSKAMRQSLMSSIDHFDAKRRLSKLENVELSDLVAQLSQTVGAMKTKNNIVEEENVFYRTECAKLMQRLAQMNQKAQQPQSSRIHHQTTNQLSSRLGATPTGFSINPQRTGMSGQALQGQSQELTASGALFNAQKGGESDQNLNTLNMKGKTKDLSLTNQNSSEGRGHRRGATHTQFEMNSKRIPNLVNDQGKLPSNIHQAHSKGEDMIVDVDKMCFKSPFKRRGEIAQFQRNIEEDENEDGDDLEFKPQYSMSPTAAVMHPIAQSVEQEDILEAPRDRRSIINRPSMDMPIELEISAIKKQDRYAFDSDEDDFAFGKITDALNQENQGF